jgi:hypothetical protein
VQIPRSGRAGRPYFVPQGDLSTVHDRPTPQVPIPVPQNEAKKDGKGAEGARLTGSSRYTTSGARFRVFRQMSIVLSVRH